MNVTELKDMAKQRSPVPPPEPTTNLGERLGRVRQELPSWTGSFFVHCLILLMLVLLGTQGRHGDGTGLGFELSGGDGRPAGGGDEGTDLETLAGDLAVDSKVWESTTAELKPEVVDGASATALTVDAIEPSPFDAVDNELRSPGTGGGSGSTEGPGDGSGMGSGLSPARTGVFGIQEEASSFVYVFDRSESMNSVLTYTSEGSTTETITPLLAAKAELVRSLKDLNSRQRFQIIFYNHEPLAYLDRMVEANDANVRKAAKFIEKTPGEGSTFHAQPLMEALKLRPEAIFLLTDGQGKDDPTPAELEEIRKANRGRTRINVVHFCFVPRDAGLLSQLASENGGKFITIDISQLSSGLKKHAR